MDNRYWILIVAALACVALIVIVLVTDRSRRKNDALATELGEIREGEQDLVEYKASLEALRDQLSEQIILGVMDQGLAERCRDVYGRIATGSPLLDSLLAQKQTFCEEHGIRFDCSISQVPEGLDDRDLVGLFGNLLDNAIEAALCYAASTGDEGWVRLKARRTGRQWTMTVENAKPAEEMPLAAGMRSTKKSPGEHGLGSKIIDRTVREQRGFVRRTDRGETFQVLVTMPMEEA